MSPQMCLFRSWRQGCGSSLAVGKGGDLSNTEKSVRTDGDSSAFRGTLSRNGVDLLTLYFSTAFQYRRGIGTQGIAVPA